MDTSRRHVWPWLAIGVAAVTLGCGDGKNGGSTSRTGGATGGPHAGGSGGAGVGGTGGAWSATGTGGTSSSGGSGSGGVAGAGGGAGGLTGTGGQAAGGSATGGSVTGGSTASSGTGGSSGSGGRATGGAPATGGQGGGGGNSGGATGTGGTGSGGSTSSTGGQGGRASGGAPGTGGRATGGAFGTGGATGTGGASGTGGATGFSPCPTDGSACKIMPFGDSITDGFGVAGGYRVELFRRAHQAGKNITFVGSLSNGPAQVDGVSFPPKHEGHSGYTIDNAGGRSGIAPLVSTVMPTHKPHIVLLMIGTNDAIDNYDMGRAPARLGALIDSIFAQLPNILLVVAQPIPSQDDALNQRIQSYNLAIPDVVKPRTDAGKQILVVNMYAVLAANPSYKTALLQDTWHPNADGHALIGARWYEVLASSP